MYIHFERLKNVQESRYKKIQTTELTNLPSFYDDWFSERTLSFSVFDIKSFVSSEIQFLYCRQEMQDVKNGSHFRRIEHNRISF